MMSILGRLRLRTKLALLLVLSALAVVISIGAAASLMHQRMFDDRIDKLRAEVQSAIGIAKILDVEVVAKRLTVDQALDRLGASIHGMRFDDGAGYIIVRRDSVILLHGADPQLEGKPSGTKDAGGRPLTDLIQNALRDNDAGVVTYLFPKPGQAQSAPQLKVSYVTRFAPWQVVFFAGAYVDDLDAAFHGVLLRLGSIGAGVLLVTLLAAWAIDRDIGGSLGTLKTAMGRLAEGDLSTEVPATGRHDEVGEMAAAVQVFKEHMKKEKIALGQEKEHQRAAVEKHAALVGMVDTIEAETTKAINEVGARTAAMTATAEEMAASAARTGNSAESAAAASGQALANAQTVASAAEQLSASIHEIGIQVAQSSTIVGRAVAAGSETRASIEALNEQVGHIGAVADMISEIAAKTNLLALNATIEAARAGDAGKGFAVVASEVKALANQTARSTEEIAQHIDQVRSATGVSVAAVVQIEQTIGEIETIARSIASAVEEQGAATAEIARNVGETAAAANMMTDHATNVSTEAEQTGKHAAAVCNDAAALDVAVNELRHSVIRVVRTTTTEMDRRHERRYPEGLACRLDIDGRSSAARVFDLSEHGAYVRGAPSVAVGARGTVTIDGVDFALPFSVRASAGDGLHLHFELDDATAERFRPMPERLATRRAA